MVASARICLNIPYIHALHSAYQVFDIYDILRDNTSFGLPVSPLRGLQNEDDVECCAPFSLSRIPLSQRVVSLHRYRRPSW